MKNGSLRDKYPGERIFILGEGASLRDMDLASLKDEYTMGCNYITLHKDSAELNLKFYALAASRRQMKAHDVRVREATIPGSFEKALFALDKMTKNSPTRFFFDVSMSRFIGQNELFSHHEVFYAMSENGLEPGKKVELDITEPLSTMEGSLFFMMTLAAFMGFTEIYLCGCGYTYVPHQHGHFYDDFVLVEGEELDPRHRLLQEALTKKNMTVYNLVPDGFKSPVYKAVPLRELKKVLSRRAA
jgi:hypothetical protein